MIEQKLKTLRNILGLTLALVVILLGVVIYQGQQLNDTRDTLRAMQKQAGDAVAQFRPQLDQRLSSLEGRLDGMDGKMKQAEDHFVSRMNQEMPRMLDAYLDKKLKEFEKKASTVTRR